MSSDSHRRGNQRPQSIALDDFLRDGAEFPSGSLTDDELAARLAPGPQTAYPRSVSVEETLARHLPPNDPNAPERSSVDSAVKTAAHSVKVLAPILSRVLQWVDPGDTEQLTKVMGTVLGRIRDDAQVITRAFGVPDEECPAWLTSQISGALLPCMLNALERNNGLILDAEDKRYLAPIQALAERAQEAGLASPLMPVSTDWKIIQGLSLATADVMTEYHAFSYFHEDPAGVAQMVTDYLSERVVDGTLAEATARWSLTEQERGYLGTTLLAQAGKMLARCWTQGIAETMEYVRQLPAAQRREIIVSGYPLDPVFDSFERLYRGLEVSTDSALRAQSPHREVELEAVETKTHAPRPY